MSFVFFFCISTLVRVSVSDVADAAFAVCSIDPGFVFFVAKFVEVCIFEILETDQWLPQCLEVCVFFFFFFCIESINFDRSRMLLPCLSGGQLILGLFA
jgi:hypothetical protein